MNFWIGLIIAIVALLSIAAASMVWVVTSISRERVTLLTTLNPAGAVGRALLVFHPGLSDFPERTMTAFAEGLAQSGWSVDLTTASGQAPVNVADYGLIVVGSPIYGGVVGKPAADYLVRLGDFVGKPVVIVLTGAGDTAAALDATEASIKALNGKVVGRFAFTTMRPNESAKPYPGSNVDKAIAMARDAGKALALTPVQ
ncbi:MAG: flavodoxin family protein [Devosia sp.]